MYADDLKLFLKICSTDDCQQLQQLIDLFASWCSRNFLIVSVPKCVVISFSRKKNDIEYQYLINNQQLTRVSEIKDLGVILDKKLTFHNHYLQIIAKANRNLGFIMRVAHEFRDPYCLKALYYSLVRSVLDSNSVVWSPNSNNWITRIESIQSKFVRFALRFLPWTNRYELPPYVDRCQLIGMESLYKRRNDQKALFVAKLLSCKIDSPKILSMIGIYAIERPLRVRGFLHLPTRRTLYGLNEPIRSMCSVFNSVYYLFDFDSSIESFKNRLRNNR